MNIMQGLLYSKTHEWVKVEGDHVRVGLSDFAQHEMGDIVFVNLPEEGDMVTAGEAFTDIESVKAVSDVYAPVSGRIVAVNEELADDPALINSDCYEAWIVELEEVGGLDDLMDSTAYETFVASAE